jgi:hypothetical protein
VPPKFHDALQVFDVVVDIGKVQKHQLMLLPERMPVF